MSSSETELLFWRVAVNTFTFLCVWNEDSFTQMKPSNAHEVILRAVLEMFIYLCPHLVSTNTSGSVLTCVCAYVCVCVCVRTGAELRCARYRERDHVTLK